MSWDVGLPRVSSVVSTVPKRLTLIYPYYGNPRFLQKQLRWWHALSADLRQHLRLVVVDDGTPWSAGAASEVLVGADLPLTTRLFRIVPDVPWNWLAARNIGAHYAEDGWLLLTDIDHVVPQRTLERIVYGLAESAVYAFERIEHTGVPIHPHSASFLMTRALFWQIGGYDERYSGHYGSDGRYRKRLRAMAPLWVLTERLIRHEKQGDSSTTTYQRKLQADNEALARIDTLVEADPTPLILSFEYAEVPL